MIEKFTVPVLAAAALSCGAAQLRQPSDAEIAQCTTVEQALAALGAEKEGMQPDGSFVACRENDEELVPSASGGYVYSEGLDFSDHFRPSVDAYLTVIRLACEGALGEEYKGCSVESAGEVDLKKVNLAALQMNPPFYIECPNKVSAREACPPVAVESSFMHCSREVNGYQDYRAKNQAERHIRCVRAKGKRR